MKVYDCIIIGAGPAGLMAAAQIDNSCLVLEKKRHAGLKLLITGSGQCNYANNCEKDLFLDHIISNRNFFKKSFYLFDNKKLINFFLKYNIYPDIQENNKIFPVSRKAKDVQSALLTACEEKEVHFKYDQHVKEIKRDSHFFWITTEHDYFLAKNLVISTGGKSYPSTGSTGDGYKFAKEMGHKIIEPRPGLSPIYVFDYQFSQLAGISAKVEIIVTRNKKKVLKKKDDILFTHKGFSGPVILNNSSLFRKNDNIQLIFSDSNLEKLLDDFNSFKRDNSKKSIKSFFLKKNVSKRYLDLMFNILKIPAQKNINSISKKDTIILLSNILLPIFTIKDIEGFNSAMITAGGVSTKEINSKTMESKIIKGLYFAGEIIDIDAETGGYNLQVAFSTGYTAGTAIKKTLEKL